jgi:pseudaminic acid biosynthesis-associated methylase
VIKPTRLDQWRGEFGDRYTQRNVPTEDAVARTARAFGAILQRLPSQPVSILEAGANVGRNIRALAGVSTAELYAVEPNASARAELEKVLPAGHVFDADLLALPLGDASVDLAFTCGVLIHIGEEDIPGALAELYRVSRHWLLCMEYFSPSTDAVRYHGHDDLLFKRDYGALWLDHFGDGLNLLDYGFLWKRTTGFDDLTWWLFDKRGG